MKHDKLLEIFRRLLFMANKAVSHSMTRLIFMTALFGICIDTFILQASAQQNYFFNNGQESPTRVAHIQSRDPELVSGQAAAPASTTSNRFDMGRGTRVGRGRGGDTILRVTSTDRMTIHPTSLALSEVLIEAMDTHFGQCVKDSARAAGITGDVSNIKINHMGGYVDRRVNNGSRRRNRNWSLHASGRALDVEGIEFTAGGRSYNVPMTKRTHDGRNRTLGNRGRLFYRAFSACWSEKNRNSCGSRPALDCNFNRLHHDHIHIAVPFCPRQPGIASS